ncbi:MAG: CYTH domain-containing protein [Minisyncoccia bacterium]
MADTYEVEVKSLLGSEEAARAFRVRLTECSPETTLRSSHSQLNHYFEGGDIALLAEALSSTVSTETAAKLARIAAEGRNLSVRTRKADEAVKIVVKASVGDDTSENGVARIEIEEALPLSLDSLDALVLSAGYTYQAKWSRTREEYESGAFSVCLDKNAGYGYLAEIERVVDREDAVGEARAAIDSFMETLGIRELPQERLERMFAHYNTHWQEYYGTDKIFVLE